MIATVVLGSLAVLSLALTIWQVTVAARFPLHRRRTGFDAQPGVTIFKPLKGCDAETAACLRSWMTQDYSGPIQILFGVTSVSDPVCKLVEDLIDTHPECAAQLVICGNRLGSNAKVSTLMQLEPYANHGLFCVSDADVWAPRDFLANAVAQLKEPGVGLVHCFYRLVQPANFAMRWEAFAVNADFWSQVLQSRSMKPMDFALGAAMVFPRQRLAAAGGFDVLVDRLADDYHLGQGIARKGGSIELCPAVVECRSATMSFAEVWLHQLRWARTIRACEPGPFFFSILSNATLWPMLWVALTPSLFSLVAVGICVASRMAAGFFLEKRLLGRGRISSCFMAPLKDGLHAGIWALSFAGRRVNWRGERYEVVTGGKLMKTSEPLAQPLSTASNNLQRTLD